MKAQAPWGSWWTAWMRAAAAALVVLLWSSQAMPAGAVSTPTPNPPVNCPAEPDLTLDARPELALLGLSGRAVPPSPLYFSRHQDIELTWTGLALDEGCIAVYVRGPVEDTFSSEPHTRLGPPQANWAHHSIDSPGQYCHRLVAVSGTARGPFAEICTDVRAVNSAGEPRSSPWPRMAFLGALGALIVGGSAFGVRRWLRTS